MVRSTPAEPPAAPLTDGVIAVRERRPADVDAIVAAGRDPETRRWLDDPPPATGSRHGIGDPPVDAETRRANLARVRETWRSGRAAPLVIADAATDEPVGLINLQFRDDAHTSVAYSVFPESRGRGVAPRAVRLVADWAMAELGVARLLLEADAENGSSIRVAEKCGFHRIGTRTEESGETGRRRVIIFALDAGSTAAG